MSSDSDNAIKMAVALVALILALIVGVLLIVPDVIAGVSAIFEPGMGIKESAKYSFLLTTIMIVGFALAAGDGLLGELQFMLSGFFGLFLFNTLLLAWIF